MKLQDAATLRAHVASSDHPESLAAIARLEALVFQLDAALATALIDLPRPEGSRAAAVQRTHEVVQAARAAVREARAEVQ